MRTEKRRMTPGSKDAVAVGCTCPVLDNAHGRGAYQINGVWQFWQSVDCVVHNTALHAARQGVGA